MKSSEEHFESQQASPGGFSDIRALQQNTAASVGELREFLGQLRGRSAQEVMGIVAQSSLFQGIASATLGCAVLIGVFTIGPWLLAEAPGTSAQAESPVVASDDGDASESAASESEQSADGTAQETTSEPDLERAAEAMGIDGTADADPNKNPLDSRLDKLLDGIE